MWVGTFSGGVCLFNIDANKFTHYKHTSSPKSLSHNNVLSIFEDSDENLWVGTDGGGINKMNRKTGTFTHFKQGEYKKSISGNYVLRIIEDSEYNLWIGTWGDGITVYNRKKNTYKYFKSNPTDANSIGSSNVWVIFEDSDKDIWVGTYSGGLDLYNKEKNNFSHYQYNSTDPNSISSNVINVIFEASDGYLWIGTNGGGLNRFDKKNKIFKHFKHDEIKLTVSSNTINCLHEDRHKNLWVGTDQGLTKLNLKTHAITNYHVEHGLPSQAIYGILEDDNENLWISTNKGLSKFDPTQKIFKNFGVSDGLQSNDFKQAYCKSKSGKMYFGGTNGFNEFSPYNIKSTKYDPPLVLTGFQIFNKPVQLVTDRKGNERNITTAKEITLSYKQSVISFEFSSLNYTARDKRQYSYMLEGFDRDWNMVGTQHTATYTNLDPENYVFKVKGLDNEGNWSEKKIVLNLIITPPYWQTWWFRILMVSFIGGCLGLFFWVRIGVVKKQKQELEHQVEIRTKELACSTEEERIARYEAEKARQEAERASQAKSVFLATMSHEMRTPMNGVIGMASLLSETPQTSEQLDYTETIKSCGEALLGVINDILDYSKIESGKMDLEEKDFDLRICIEEVLDVFTTRVSHVGLDLIYHIDQNVPTQIIGDNLRLRQVMLNLVGNAIKFTPRGEVFVGIHLLNTVDNKIEIGFEIRDTGIGIAEDKLGQLFQAFSQVDTSTTRKYGGTGLGLVICEKLVALMGGNISVQSQPGRGTTFTFSIHTTISQQLKPTNTAQNLFALENKKVLIIEDNTTVQNVLKSQLTQWKLIPTVTSSGAEALAILSMHPDFDLILCDAQMPEMDGLELAQHIHQKQKKIPVILLSFIGDERIKSHTEFYSSVVTKPIRQSTLFKYILAQFTKQQDKPVADEINGKNKLSADFSKQYPLSILIAEDNPVNQKLAERVLMKLGYSPEMAMNGQDALDALERKHYDVILMDVQMPIMDGLEATKKIRMLRKEPQPIIIAVTANAIQGDREICLQAGMDDYISKPIKLEDLVNMLEKWSYVMQDRTE
jgi:signal transduction histidine kinase/DNA-binding response OmpR family regulator/ligand-binding sensor domain-containing protein